MAMRKAVGGPLTANFACPRAITSETVVGLALASVFFIPVLRAITGLPDVLYVIPVGFLCLLAAARVSVGPVPVHHSMRALVSCGIALCLWLLLTSYWSISSQKVYADIKLVSYLLALLVVVPFVLTNDAVRWTLNWVIVAGLFTAGFVFIGYWDAGTLRGYGTPVHEFYLTASALLGASLVASVARLSVTQHLRLRSCAVPLVLLGGLALSLGRMSLLSAVVLIIAIALYALLSPIQNGSRRGVLLRRALSAMLALLVATGLLLGALQVERTARRLERALLSPLDELAAGGRGEIWYTAWANLGSALVVGYGLGSSGLVMARSEGLYPHNIVLQVWLEAGLIGVILLLTTLAIPLAGFWRRRRRKGAKAALPFLVVYLFFVMGYLVSSNAYTARPILLSAMLTIFAATCSQRYRPRGKTRNQPILSRDGDGQVSWIGPDGGRDDSRC